MRLTSAPPPTLNGWIFFIRPIFPKCLYKISSMRENCQFSPQHKSTLSSKCNFHQTPIKSKWRLHGQRIVVCVSRQTTCECASAGRRPASVRQQADDLRMTLQSTSVSWTAKKKIFFLFICILCIKGLGIETQNLHYINVKSTKCVCSEQ